MHYEKDRDSYYCGGYRKHSSAFCSSHKTKKSALLEAVKSELKELVKSNVSIDKLYETAISEINKHLPNYQRELLHIETKLSSLEIHFNKLFELYTKERISDEQFSNKNQQLLQEQEALFSRKAILDTKLNDKANIEKDIARFKDEVDKIVHLDFDNEEILKQIIHTLIQKIEVYENGKIKICYNISNPLLIVS